MEMSLTINHNLMASNVARNLSNHYSSLSNSVRRLSSGLRINSAADDAAGLAIRELMRADIAALNQGVRNVTDAISMLQTADGALSVIDEKLIRMKELAEQAATGTYNSDQRLVINSEFQAMAAEIERIANATDFNGVKLLNNDPTNKLNLNTGIELRSWVGGIGGHANYQIDMNIEIVNPTAITSSVENLTFSNNYQIHLVSGDENILNWDGYGNSTGSGGKLSVQLSYSIDTGLWTLLNQTGPGEAFEYYTIGMNGTRILEISGYTDNTKTIQSAYFAFGSNQFNDRPVILHEDTLIEIDFYNNYGWILIDGDEQYSQAQIVSIDEVEDNGVFNTAINIDLTGDGTIDFIHHLSRLRIGWWKIKSI
jgi:flagellin-like hook-associated protein FlgL